MAEKTNIYILRLEGGKYYVGKSSNVTERYMQHLSGKGSAWTKKYKPVQLLKTITNVSHFEEDRYVKEYMSKFGIDNVRGGAYVIDKLNEQDIDTLNKEIRAATDKCTNCGKAGHWVKDCYAKKNNTRNKIEYDEDLDEKPVKKNKNNINNKIEYDEDLHKKPLNKKVKSVKQTDTCYRCGRTGHYSPDCYARSHREGYDLSDNDDDEDDEDDEDDDDDDDEDDDDDDDDDY